MICLLYPYQKNLCGLNEKWETHALQPSKIAEPCLAAEEAWKPVAGHAVIFCVIFEPILGEDPTCRGHFVK